VLGERVTWLDLVGGALVIGSLALDARTAPAGEPTRAAAR
jgi:drug/metabolite transporter (DMT)-like permease